MNPDREVSSGRPRDQQATEVLKETARALVRKQGYADVSISQIISQAGVSRQTLYRRWPGKADLVLEAFYEAAGEGPDPDSSDPVREQVLNFFCSILDHLDKDWDAICSLIAAAQGNEEFSQRFFERFVEPRQQLLIDLLQRSIASGELAENTDVALITDLFHGAFWYRMLNGLPMDRAYAQRLVDQLIRPADVSARPSTGASMRASTGASTDASTGASA